MHEQSQRGLAHLGVVVLVCSPRTWGAEETDHHEARASLEPYYMFQINMD